MNWTFSRSLRAMGRGCLGTSIQPPFGLVYGGGSFWYFLPPVSLGTILLKRSWIRCMLGVEKREAHAGWPRGLSHVNGSSFPGAFFGGGLAGLGALVADTLSLRTCDHVLEVPVVSVADMDGCGDSSSWNRKLEAHVSTSYSKTFGDTSVSSSISPGDLVRTA